MTALTRPDHRTAMAPSREGAPDPAGLLRAALRANAVFSATSGLVLGIGAPALDGWVGVHAAVLIGLGVGLLGWAALAARVAGGAPIQRRDVVQIIIGDLVWVVGAVVLVLGWPDLLTSAGRWALGAVTLVVADLAVVQVIGLRRADRGVASVRQG